jgi:hypothetical protein
MPLSPTISNDVNNNENLNKTNHLKFRGGSMKSHSNRTAQYNKHRSKKHHDIKSSSPHHSVASSNGSHCNNSHKFGSSSFGGGTTTSSVTSRSSRRSSIAQQIEAMRARILRRSNAVHPAAPVTEVDWSGIGNDSDSEDELPLISEFHIDYKHHKYYDELVDNYFQDALSSVSSPPFQEKADAISSRRRAPRIIDSQQFEI